MNARARHTEFATLADKPAVCFGLRAEAAAAAVGVSLTFFLELVKEGLMPKPFPVPGHPRVLLYDPEDVRNAVREWKDRANSVQGNPWDE